MPVNVNEVTGVLRLCFTINKVMVRVIANAAEAALASMMIEWGLPPGGGGDVYVPTTTTTRHRRGEGG